MEPMSPFAHRDENGLTFTIAQHYLADTSAERGIPSTVGRKNA